MFTLSQWNWYKRNQRKHDGAFGDFVGVQFRPLITLKATYGVLDNAESFSATGGAVSAESGEFLCSSGTSLGGYGTVWTRRPLVYIPGLGAEARVTARFPTAGVPLSTQLVGFFTGADGMFFGYDGEDFGIMHRHGGAFEIRKIQVTAAATGAETVTVTLNGTAYNTTVTSGTATQNAHEIEQDLLADPVASAQWNFQHVGDSIFCIYKGVGAKSGSYSVSSTGTLTATVTQIEAGVTPNEDWTYQSSWNQSTASWLDVTKGNLYRFEYAYLGYGPLNYYVMNNDQQWELVHTVKWNNQNTGVNLGNPSMRVGWAAASLGSTGTDLQVYGASAMSGLQGKTPEGRDFGMAATNPAITTEEHIISAKVRREFNGAACNAIALPSLSCSTDSTKGMIFRVYRNATVTGVTDHQYVDQDQSIMIYDDVVNQTVSGGRLLGVFVVGPSGSVKIDSDKIGPLVSGDEITVTGQVTSGASSAGSVTINTEELV